MVTGRPAPASPSTTDDIVIQYDVSDADGDPISSTVQWSVNGIVVSSQGDNAYAVFDLATGDLVGRFRIAADKLGATSETDGIELATGDFGPDFPGGLFVAQDGDNAPAAQNFKFVAWSDVIEALTR